MLTVILMSVMIFVLKIVEVSIATTRIILITKGERKVGAVIALAEISLWLFLVATVVTKVQDNIVYAVVYALGFAVGQFVGSLIEDKVAIGTVRVEAIILREHEAELSLYLRSKGYAVTVVEATGKDFPRSILLFYVARKNVNKLTNEIKEHQHNVVLIADDIKPLYGGYGKMSGHNKRITSHRRMKKRK